MFWLALSLIIVGSGFLKANISVIVGQLYRLTDTRRDGAYTIFYMGVNVGAALGTILVGYLGETVGWPYGFGLAGIGMVIGLIIFVIGQPALRGRGEAPDAARLAAPAFGGIKLEWLLYVDRRRRGGGDLDADPVPERDRLDPAAVSGVALLVYVLVEAFKLDQETARPDVRDHVPDRAAAGVLGHVRTGGRVAQPVHRPLRRPRRGADQPVPVDQPDLHRAAGAVVRWLWTKLGRRGLEPSTPAKFGLGAAPGWVLVPRPGVGRADASAGGADPGDLHVLDLSAPDDRRAVPVAGGPVRDEPPAPRCTWRA